MQTTMIITVHNDGCDSDNGDDSANDGNNK